MFHLRVTIEVVNDVGNVVDHRGYAVQPGYKRGVPMHAQLDLFGEGGKPMDIASAQKRLNSFFAATRSIGETING